jgi:hypothetical protein
METLEKVFILVLFIFYFFSHTSASSSSDFSLENETDISLNTNKNESYFSDEIVLSRHKRNFGGTEPINFSLVFDSIFGVKGWLSSGIEITQDIVLHVTGYTIIGLHFIPSSF